jgi:hypothetical protein
MRVPIVLGDVLDTACLDSANLVGWLSSGTGTLPLKRKNPRGQANQWRASRRDRHAGADAPQGLPKAPQTQEFSEH